MRETRAFAAEGFVQEMTERKVQAPPTPPASVSSNGAGRAQTPRFPDSPSAPGQAVVELRADAPEAETLVEPFGSLSGGEPAHFGPRSEGVLEQTLTDGEGQPSPLPAGPRPHPGQLADPGR